MSRRNPQNPDQSAESTETDAQVDQSASTEDSTQESTTETPTEETKAAAPDTSSFKSALDAAVATADPADGSVSDENLKPVLEAFGKLDGQKARNAAKRLIEDGVTAEVSNGNLIGARSYIAVRNAVSSATVTSAPKPPADPTAAYVQRQTAVRLAVAVLGLKVPEGVSDEWADKVKAAVETDKPQLEAYAAWLATGESEGEPEVSRSVKAAFKIASGKGMGGGGGKKSGDVYSGPRRDVGTHIGQVFAKLEVGSFLTVNEIAKAASEEYGNERPSSGAISARLFPKPGKNGDRKPNLPSGIESDATGASRGARKVA